MRAHLNHLLLLSLGLGGLAGCGGADGSTAEPLLIPGGGATGGAIDGVLHVHAIDEHTGTPIVGATVTLGDRETASPASGTTSAAGLVTFDDVLGPQQVTVAASGYRATTMIGLDTANLTVELRPRTSPVARRAHVTGTISGWDALPAPPENHILAGIVSFSQTTDFDDPANGVEQPDVDPTPNICFKTVAASPPCAWDLETRVGPQALIAFIADVDTKGTPTGDDDSFTVTGVGIRRGLDVTEGQTLTGQDVTLLPAGAFGDLTVSFETAPTGLDAVNALPILRLGDEGQLMLPFNGATPTGATISVPLLTGELAAASYELFAGAGSETARTSIVHPDAQPGTVAIGAWLPLPTGPSATAGTYAFQAAVGANIHAAAISDESGELWDVVVLDDTTSFTLPTLTPDPLPAGRLRLKVSALDLEDFDPTDFRLDGIRDALRRISENATTFTH